MAKGIKTGGREKGTPNKATLAVKGALIEAFDELGGVAALVTWGRENQGEFYKLWVRILPQEIKAELTGDLSVTRAPLPAQDKALLAEYAKAD